MFNIIIIITLCTASNYA